MKVSLNASSTVVASVHSLSRNFARSAANVRRVRSRRMASIARRRAAVSSHAGGLSGTPCCVPVLERSDERLLHDVFGERQVLRSEQPDEHRNQPAGFAAKKRFDGVWNCFRHERLGAQTNDSGPRPSRQPDHIGYDSPRLCPLHLVPGSDHMR